jgi:3-dehydroquinate dehydratase
MRKKINTMKDIMINIIRMKGEINMKKTGRDHTEREVEKRIQEIKDIAMKEAIINPEGITGTPIEIKEIIMIKEIDIIIEIGEI